MPFDLQDCKKAFYKNHPQSYLSTTEHGILFLAQDVTQIISSVSLDQAFSYSRKKWVVDIEGWVFLKPTLVSILIENCERFEKEEIRSFFGALIKEQTSL